MDTHFLRWLLEVDIRAKNATALLIALATVVLSFFSIADAQWFEALTPWGQVASLVVVLLMSFLAVWLAWTAIHSLRSSKLNRALAVRKAVESQRGIREHLESLTEWQRQFVLRFVEEGRTQIPECEIGRYRAAYGPELDVLVTKGIVVAHSEGMYELKKPYLDYLQQHWNPESETLD